MKLKTCEYCGTEYNSELRTCPLCGKMGEAEQPRQSAQDHPRRGGARVAQRKSRKAPPPDQDKIPRWMWALICIILGLAVLLGAGYFVYVMGFFGSGSPSTQVQVSDTQTQEPADDATDTPAEPDDTADTDMTQENDTPATSGVPCTALTLSQEEVTLDEAGGRIFLTAVSRPADCTDEITYASSDESIVTINENGMITAVAPGEAEIIVTCGSITERCTIQCDFEAASTEPDTPDDGGSETQQPDVSSADGSDASLSSTDFTLFRPGEKTTLTVHNAPADATITYVSSDTSVATVTNTGEVTAVGSGTATITVTVNSTKLTCIARCNLGDSAETGGTGTAGETGGSDVTYSLSHTDVTLFSSGESFQITVSPTASSVSWASSNSAVCTVDGSGNVTAVGSGTANVTATINGKTYTCIVRCGF